ncbi:MAG: helix-turn-helix transcriptional regulator [Sporichthyaceae bacterium]
MNPELYLTTREVAERFRTAESTVRYWRSIDYGPAGVRVGRRVLYRASDVEAWEREHLGGVA